MKQTSAAPAPPASRSGQCGRATSRGGSRPPAAPGRPQPRLYGSGTAGAARGGTETGSPVKRTGRWVRPRPSLRRPSPGARRPRRQSPALTPLRFPFRAADVGADGGEIALRGRINGNEKKIYRKKGKEKKGARLPGLSLQGWGSGGTARCRPASEPRAPPTAPAQPRTAPRRALRLALPVGSHNRSVGAAAAAQRELRHTADAAGSVPRSGARFCIFALYLRAGALLVGSRRPPRADALPGTARSGARYPRPPKSRSVRVAFRSALGPRPPRPAPPRRAGRG